MISSMVGAHGQEVFDRQSIAEVFAAFYAELYEDKNKTDSDDEGEQKKYRHSVSRKFTLHSRCSKKERLRMQNVFVLKCCRMGGG